jgi:hypothetical protein
VHSIEWTRHYLHKKKKNESKMMANEGERGGERERERLHRCILVRAIVYTQAIAACFHIDRLDGDDRVG